MPDFDPNELALAVTNELFYENGPEPRAIEPRSALLVKAVIAEALQEAYNAGFNSATGISQQQSEICKYCGEPVIWGMLECRCTGR